MASRPFAQVYVEVGKSLIASSARSLRKRRKVNSTNIHMLLHALNIIGPIYLNFCVVYD